MQLSLPLTRDLVLIGGGHTHALVLRDFGMRPVPGVRLTLVDPGPSAAYSGMLPGHVAGHYARSELDIDLMRLARFAGARAVVGAATALDPVRREITVSGRPPIRYDIASLDVGITSAMPDLPGFDAHGVPAKPLGAFAARWAAFVADAAGGTDSGGRARVVVIGAGVAGVELAMAMAHRLKSAGVASPNVTLVEANRMAASLGTRARAVLRRRLVTQGITLLENAQVTHLTDGMVHLDGAAPLPFGFCVGTAGARPHGWLAESGLAHTDGFVDVDPCLRSVSDHAVYAVGDCAHLTFAPRPKAGVFAVREAPVLAHNLRADLIGFQRRHYRPQRDYLKLISLGGREALVERGPLTLAAPWLWRLKNRIDQAFMDKFRDLPAMEATRVPPGAARGVRKAVSGGPPCGGCGAKVGPDSLAQALAGLARPARTDLASPPGDDAALVKLGDTRQVLSTDHLRAVVEDPWLMARIAAIHALGDVWAMGARPQLALASLILPRMSSEMQRATLAEITDAANAVFTEAGATLAGGHTTLGSELTIGFTVTGLCDGEPITLAGARPGDALILTRALGSGTLLAGEMRLAARGADIVALYDAMTRPQQDASQRIAKVAHAMTDVTGFGLAGHLLNILRASDVGAEVNPGAVPLHPGAEALAARGIRSTLAPEITAHAMPLMDGFGDTPRERLLFDPQTCGGLLAAVPEARCADLLRDLRALEPKAARIGTVTAGAPCIRSI